MRQRRSASGATPRVRARRAGSSVSGSSKRRRRSETRIGMAHSFAAAQPERGKGKGLLPPCLCLFPRLFQRAAGLMPAVRTAGIKPATRRRWQSALGHQVRDADLFQLLTHLVGGLLADVLELVVQGAVGLLVGERRLAA